MTGNQQGLRERIGRALADQQAKTVTVLSSLLAIEDALGYVPDEAIREVAVFTHSTINDVWAVASFYPNFRFTPPGEHVLEVCWGPTCHLLGARRLNQTILQELGLQGEGDTPDGRVSLKYNTCLGACSQGPLVRVDERVLGPRALGTTEPQEMARTVTEMVSRSPNGTSHSGEPG